MEGLGQNELVFENVLQTHRWDFVPVAGEVAVSEEFSESVEYHCWYQILAAMRHVQGPHHGATQLWDLVEDFVQLLKWRQIHQCE